MPTLHYDLRIQCPGSYDADRRALRRARTHFPFTRLVDEIFCEAFAGPVAMGIIEIGTATHGVHRGRGCATSTCAHLIQACEELGYQTYWNCAKQNLASAAMAHKLGYRIEREYRLLAWLKMSSQPSRRRGNTCNTMIH